MRSTIRSIRSSSLRPLAFCVATAALCAAPALQAQAYKVTNLVSDGSVPAVTTDAGFTNPWAISTSGTFWISAQASGYNYVINPTTGAISFKVVVPTAAAPQTANGLPAGSVTTTGASGMLLPNGTKASFLFSTLDGSISGWNSKLGTAGAISQVAINNAAAGASYPGLAIINPTATTSYILAANFGAGNSVEVYDSTFKPVKLTGSFTDPTLPSGYAPFGIHVLNGQVFVTYALRTATAPFRTVSGSGNGVVSIFDLAGNFVARAVTSGNLNAPWGVAYAPATFGIFSGALLIGNFGDGKINAYDPKTFAYLGQLMDSTGKSLQYDNLWELLAGGTAIGNSTSVSGGDTSTVYFTAGLTNEIHGLLGGISSATTAGATPTFGFTASAGAATVTAGNATKVLVSIAPVNGFSGIVTLTCSGLPVGAFCAFSPGVLNAGAGVASYTTLTINTSAATASLAPTHATQRTHTQLAALLLFPLSALLWVGRRRTLRGSSTTPRTLAMLALALLATTAIAGCADNSIVSLPVTPKGHSTVTLVATSGTVSQQTTMDLNVQ